MHHACNIKCITPVDRQTPAKTLPSRNFVCGRLIDLSQNCITDVFKIYSFWWRYALVDISFYVHFLHCQQLMDRKQLTCYSFTVICPIVCTVTVHPFPCWPWQTVHTVSNLWTITTFTLGSTALPVHPRYQVPVCPPEHALHFRVFQPNQKSVNCFKPNYFKPLPFSFKLSLKNFLFCPPKRVDIDFYW